MNFKKTNNIVGWIVCLIACTTYILTAEAGGSLWDCGEFVSSCFKLQVPHPPGAPMFVLLGRLFIVLFGDDAHTAAKAVNIMSALASGFTILFLFWTITHFARRIVHTNTAEALTSTQIMSIMGAGIVGALAYTFSDSFWYSAVEGEVYAMSSFFTALVFWAILKWEHQAHEKGADKWIVFIFFMMGLSIGVHLLNLLTIPAIVMVYYLRKRDSFNYTAIRKWFVRLLAIGGGLGVIGSLLVASSQSTDNVKADSTMTALILLAAGLGIGLLYLVESMGKKQKDYYGGMYIFFVLGCVITGVVQVAVIQYSIKMAGKFDVLFVNSFNMPFFSGFAFFFILLAVLIWLGLRYATKKGLYYLRLSLWCFAFMLIGYSTYLTTMIRSSADTAIDMYNVDNPMSLVGYLGRDQYGDFPIVYGTKFTTQGYADKKEGGVKYQKGKNSYIENGREIKYLYQASDKMVFPRIWDNGNERGQSDYYATVIGNMDRTQDGSWTREVTQKDNFNYFFQYQMNFMYFRYFMWNFAGKQNDVQGSYTGNDRDGNWISGISFIDEARLGDQSKLPDSIKNNKAHNKLYMLPFILGMIGLFYHFRKKGGDALVNMLLFFFTGLAIVIYLNQTGNQPRERDYAYVGSFYAFAVWIGLSVTAFIDFALSKDRKILYSILIGCATVFVATIIATLFGGSEALSGVMVSAFIAIVAVAAFYLFGFIQTVTKNAGVTTATVSLACLLAAPVMMAQQEWDDHDRSKKQMSRDLAIDYLESCDKDAILFTFGDNDTYPLWYAQEVEGIRPDIRVINTSLLGIDWYINQLRYKVNQSAAIDLIWSSDQIEGEKRNIVVYKENAAGYNPQSYYNLDSILRYYAGSDEPSKQFIEARSETSYNAFPTRKFSIPVDVNLVKQNGTVTAADSVLSEIRFDLPNKQYLDKGATAILSVIAANKWKRPIYFTNNSPYQIGLGFERFLRSDGMSYKLVPVENKNSPFVDWPFVNTDTAFNRMDTKFAFGNANLKGVYFDEENRRHLNSIREAYTDVALDLANRGKKEEAKKMLNKCDKMMLEENFPYGHVSRRSEHNRNSYRFLAACYTAGDKQLAAKVAQSLVKDLEQQQTYYASLGKTSKQEFDKLFNEYWNRYMMASQRRDQKEANAAESLLESNLEPRQARMLSEIRTNFQLLMQVKEMIADNTQQKPATPEPGAPDTSKKN